MSPHANLLALLLAGHLLADFAFQTRRMVDHKNHPGWLALHAAVVAVAQALVALPFLTLSALPLIAGLAVSHAAIDRLKAAADRPNRLGPFLADQAGHLAVLGVVCLLWPLSAIWPSSVRPLFEGMVEAWVTIALLAGAYAFNGHGGAAIVAAILDRHRLDEVTEDITDEERSRGRTIGILERVILLTLVIVGQWGALGFVIAAKSIARFKDLDKRDFSERYLIGTLASVLVAIASGLALRGFFGAVGGGG